jgi:hypothetical protein
VRTTNIGLLRLFRCLCFLTRYSHYIANQTEFEALLYKNLKTFNSNDEFPLAKFLGKDVRRLNGQLSNFETALIARITSGQFTVLKVGDIKVFGANTTNTFQHFIKI